jgi:hypothetical protein
MAIHRERLRIRMSGAFIRKKLGVHVIEDQGSGYFNSRSLLHLWLLAPLSLRGKNNEKTEHTQN